MHCARCQFLDVIYEHGDVDRCECMLDRSDNTSDYYDSDHNWLSRECVRDDKRKSELERSYKMIKPGVIVISGADRVGKLL